MPTLMALKNSWEFIPFKIVVQKRESNNDYVAVNDGLRVTPVLKAQLEYKRAGAELAEISSCYCRFGWFKEFNIL